MSKRTCRMAALALILAAVAFVGYALGHPEASFPWSNSATRALYAVYLAAVVLLLIAPGRK